MSNRKKSVAVSDGAHLKGDYHENYNNTGIYNWSGLAIGTANGSNAHTISRNNAAATLTITTSDPEQVKPMKMESNI